MPRNAVKNRARAIAHRAKMNRDVTLARKVGAALCGSERVSKALSSIDYKMSLRPSHYEIGGICLPGVAIYAAGYRKSVETVTAR